MYLDFYGLTEKPFRTTPDPRFLFLTHRHREALAQLVYGVTESQGFIVLTGEVGTGKTTLLNALRARLDPAAAVAYIFNSLLSFDEMLEYAVRDFGMMNAGGSRVSRLCALNDFLIERRRQGHATVLIIDEAQNLEPVTLEHIRLLSNFESPTGKLLQIVLVGQPELDKKLRLPDLRQLRQRVALHCSVGPLTDAETAELITTRLRVAGAADAEIFSRGAIRRIASHTRGNPRLTNIMADHCLVVGYATQRRRIDRDIVERVAALGAASRPVGEASWLRRTVRLLGSSPSGHAVAGRSSAR